MIASLAYFTTGALNVAASLACGSGETSTGEGSRFDDEADEDLGALAGSLGIGTSATSGAAAEAPTLSATSGLTDAGGSGLFGPASEDSDSLACAGSPARGSGTSSTA